MKILIQPGDYSFNAAAKQVTFSSYVNIEIENVLLITNLVDGEIIYNFNDVTRGGTVATNVLTLTYDTTLMSNSDELQIWYWDVTATQSISGTVSLSSGTLDNTTLYSGNVSVIGALAPIDTTGYESIVIQTSGVFSGIIIAESSNDGFIWNDVMINPIDEPSRQQNIQENGVFFIKCNSKYIRLSVTQLQSGSIDLLIIGRTVFGSSAADNLSYAMDKANLMPIYTEDINGPLKRDANGASIISDSPTVNTFNVGGVASGNVFLVDTTGYQSLVLQLTAITGSAPTIQASVDGINWTAVNGFGTPSFGAVSQPSVQGIYIFPTLGKYMRYLISNTITIRGSWTLRNTPASALATSLGLTSINLSSISSSGTTLAQAQFASSVNVQSLYGGIAVGSPYPPGATQVPNPVIIGGSEAPSTGALGGRVRTFLTDNAGRQYLAGVPGASNLQNITAAPVVDVSSHEGRTQIEIMAQILLELQIQNQYMYELPRTLQRLLNDTTKDVGSFGNEPHEFRNEQSIFNN
jgi:hypothetical protein